MAFKIFHIYHSHIDIGYTERQEKIAAYQADFIKQAVEYVLSPAQSARDSRAKFKFTAEGFWAVEQYLHRYGEEGKKRLLSAVRTGCFELTGGYFHLAELLNYENLSRSFDYAKDFAAAEGIDSPRVAMAADINGFSYGYAEVLHEHGIHELITCINTHHGGTPFGKPLVPFWWESHKGHRILVWNGLTYHKANLLGLIPGATPVGDPGIPGMKAEGSGLIEVRKPDDYASKRVFEMVKGLKEIGYPYDFLPLMGSGLFTDNSPCEDEHCALIEQWNAQYGDEIEICNATVAEFFEYLRENGGTFPVYRGDWTDWWTDGAASTPKELALHRNAQRVLRQIGRLDREQKVISARERAKISDKLILFAEHTWGHSHSYHNPCHLIVSQLDFRKANHAVQADILANTAFDTLTRALGEGEFTARRPFEYSVLNPHSDEIKAAVYFPTDYWEDGRFTESGGACYITDGKRNYIAQRTFTLRGSFAVAVVTLAPNEKRDFRLCFGKIAGGRRCLSKKDKTFSNDFYTHASDRGGVCSLTDKATGKQLLKGAHRLAQPVYQIFPKGLRWEAAGIGYSAHKEMHSEIYDGKAVKVYVRETGPVFTILRAEYRVKGAVRYSAEFTMYNELSGIDICAECIKTLETDPEGMYIALPVTWPGAQWYLDKPATLIKPGEQLPGTCCDFYAVDRGVIASDGETSVTVNTLDAPLVTIGGLKLWKYTTSAVTEGEAFTWLTNNKWETNFRAECAGCLESRYSIDIVQGAAENAVGVLDEHDLLPVCLRH